MDNQKQEALIKENYGNVVIESEAVDSGNPTFNYLLGALKDAYYGKRDMMDVLITYHKVLSKQLYDSRNSIKKMDKETPEEYKDLVKEQHNISLGAIDIVQITLDLLDTYIKSPTKENMATCVEALLNSQHIMKGVHDMLDENIRKGDVSRVNVQEKPEE